MTWWDAITHAHNNKTLGGRKGWRFPTVEELASLIDPSKTSAPYLPSGHPFNNVQYGQFDHYWTISTNQNDANLKWTVVFWDGGVNFTKHKDSPHFYWCVRGGQGHDAY